MFKNQVWYNLTRFNNVVPGEPDAKRRVRRVYDKAFPHLLVYLYLSLQFTWEFIIRWKMGLIFAPTTSHINKN